MDHSVLTYAVFIVHWLWNVPGLNKKYWTLQPVKIEGHDEAYTRKWPQVIYYFIYLPLFILLYMTWKAPGLERYTFQHGSITYQKEISVQYGEMTLEITYWTVLLILQCHLKLSLILSLPIQSIKWWFHLLWFLYIDKQNTNRGRGKGGRQKIRNFNHKGKRTIGRQPKSLLIFTDYQVQRCWTMILSPVKSQTDDINIR